MIKNLRGSRLIHCCGCFLAAAWGRESISPENCSILEQSKPVLVFLIGIGANAAANGFEEFVVRKFTPNIPEADPAKP
jgi:hypothetical protein